MQAPYAYLEFLVAGAERQFAEGGKVQSLSFWAFKVLCRSRMPEYQNPPVFPRTHSTGEPSNFQKGDGFVDYCAWRRYSDFEWLRSHLALAYPSTVVPPIPDKDTGDSTKDKVADLVKGTDKKHENAFANPLIAQRIRRLQLFVEGISIVQELATSEILRAFVAMEELEWIQFKTATELRLHPEKGFAKMKAAGAGFFGMLKSIGSSKVKVFDEISGLGKIRRQQRDFADALSVAAHQVGNMVKYAAADHKDLHQLDTINIQNGGKPLPVTLCYNGHFVTKAGEEKPGVVRHVDEVGEFAWVDFGTGKLEKVATTALLYPPTGIVDPAMTALHVHLSQMDAFLQQLSKRGQILEALKLQDSLWYEAHYCRAVMEVVDMVESREQHRIELTNEGAKQKDPTKKAALEAEAQQLSIVFAQECTKVTQDYERFIRPMQQRALASIMKRVGPVTIQLLLDDEWEARLQPGDAALPLLFDVPEEVIQSMNTSFAKAPAETPTQFMNSAPSAPQAYSPAPQRDPFAGSSSQNAFYVPATSPPPRAAAPPATTYTPQQSQVSPSRQNPPSATQEYSAPPSVPVFDEDTPPPPPTDHGQGSSHQPEADPLNATASLLANSTNSANAGSTEHWDGEAPPPLPAGHAHDV
jgi:hypothetical protein